MSYKALLLVSSIHWEIIIDVVKQSYPHQGQSTAHRGNTAKTEDTEPEKCAQSTGKVLLHSCNENFVVSAWFPMTSVQIYSSSVSWQRITLDLHQSHWEQDLYHVFIPNHSIISLVSAIRRNWWVSFYSSERLYTWLCFVFDLEKSAFKNRWCSWHYRNALFHSQTGV